MTRAAKAAVQTPQARLASVIKTSRDIMRKDAGLNGDLDRLPQLSWLLFLKAFDDLEQNRMIVDPGYRPALPEELRWSVWASREAGTGRGRHAASYHCRRGTSAPGSCTRAREPGRR